MQAHVSDASLWALLGLGAYHGLNPAMGWLFAVALGMQERSRRAVGRTLVALAIGHALAVGATIAIAAGLGIVVSQTALRWLTASILVSFGIYKLVSTRHPRFGSMRIGFRDLVIWSFLMASAHGAGLMLLPLVMPGMTDMTTTGGATATLIHTVGYLLVTGIVAAIVFEKVGVGFLRRGWVNVDLAWGIALVGAGVATIAL